MLTKYNCDLLEFPLTGMKHISRNSHKISSCDIQENYQLLFLCFVCGLEQLLSFSLFTCSKNIPPPPSFKHNVAISLCSKLVTLPHMLCFLYTFYSYFYNVKSGKAS